MKSLLQVLAVGFLSLSVLLAWLAWFNAVRARQNAAGIATTVSERSSRFSVFVTRSILRRLWLSLRGFLANREHQKQLHTRYHIQVAEEAAQMMGEMKGAFMKLGQILSFANQGMPEAARDALQRLQMDAPPMSFALARGVVEAELGMDLGRAFKRFDEQPLAAASIGQVHRARLHDGSEVVVKIQYPGVREAIESDLRTTDRLASMVSAINSNIDAKGVVEELRDRLFEELDYRHELRNQQLFCDIWAGHPLIRVPRVFPEHSRSRVICQEYVRGMHFHDFIAASNAKEKRLAVHAIHDFVFDSMNRYLVFNGDPHPGNYIFADDGAIAFIDYGCVKHWSRTFMDDLQALNRALVTDDKPSFEVLLKKLAVVLPGHNYDLAEIWDFFCYHVGGFRENRVFTFTAEWVNEAFRVMDPTRQRHINLPRDFVYLNRITFGLNAIMLKLEASENFHEMQRRYLYPAEQRSPALARLGVRLPDRFIPATPAALPTPAPESARRSA